MAQIHLQQRMTDGVLVVACTISESSIDTDVNGQLNAGILQFSDESDIIEGVIPTHPQNLVEFATTAADRLLVALLKRAKAAGLSDEAIHNNLRRAYSGASKIFILPSVFATRPTTVFDAPKPKPATKAGAR